MFTGRSGNLSTRGVSTTTQVLDPTGRGKKMPTACVMRLTYRHESAMLGADRRDRACALAMTPSEIREARQKLGLTLAQFAGVLGYAPIRQAGYAIESGRRRLREPQRQLLAMYLAGHRPDDWPATTSRERGGTST